MGNMQETAIIVPCYNEALRLNPIKFLEFAQQNKTVNFIFVNDGSTDNTHEILQKILESNTDQIQYIKLEKNSGKAEAVRSGCLKAISFQYKNIGFWDADLATPLSSIIVLCNILKSEDIKLVMASRVKLLGRKIDRQPSRHYLGRLFATFASFTLKLSVYDTQCGAKIFKNEPFLLKIFQDPFTVKWIFDVEILARFIKYFEKSNDKSSEESIFEYPLDSWTDVPGSKIKFGDYLTAIFELIKIYSYLNQKQSKIK